MHISKRTKIFYALAQVTTTSTTPTTPVSTPDITATNVSFNNARTVWSKVLGDMLKIANILNKALFKVSGGKVSLDRIETATTVMGTLVAGPHQYILTICQDFVKKVLNMPQQIDKESKKKIILDFKNLWLSKASELDDILPADRTVIADTLNQLLNKIEANMA